MSVRKRTWKNRKGAESVRWTVDVADASGHRERRQFNSRKEADAFRIQVENQMRSGTFRAEAGKLTVKDAADAFLLYCESRWQRRERMTRRNLKTMEGHVRNHISPDPKRQEGQVRHKRLKRSTVGSVVLSLRSSRRAGSAIFATRLRDTGVSVVTTRKIISTLQQIASYAVRKSDAGYRDIISTPRRAALRKADRQNRAAQRLSESRLGL